MDTNDYAEECVIDMEMLAERCQESFSDKIDELCRIMGEHYRTLIVASFNLGVCAAWGEYQRGRETVFDPNKQ